LIDTLSLYDLYESMLAMMYARQSSKPETRRLTDDQHRLRDLWLRDMFSLLGFVCHDLGSLSGSPRVEKYDALLMMELIRHERGLGLNQVQALLDVPGDIPELQVFHQLTLSFGMVSDVGDDDAGKRLLDRYMIFGHRTFQEFLTARALVSQARVDDLSPARLDLVPMIAKFDWKSGRVLANQWFEQVSSIHIMYAVAYCVTIVDQQVMLFVSSKMGIDWLFRKMFGDETPDAWERRLSANGGMDEDDVGHVRLACLLRALIVAQGEEDASVIKHIAKVLMVMPQSAASAVVSCSPNRTRSLTPLAPYIPPQHQHLRVLPPKPQEEENASATEPLQPDAHLAIEALTSPPMQMLTKHADTTAIDDAAVNEALSTLISPDARQPMQFKQTDMVSAAASSVGHKSATSVEHMGPTTPRTASDDVVQWLASGAANVAELVAIFAELDSSSSTDFDVLVARDDLQSVLDSAVFWTAVAGHDRWRAATSSHLITLAMKHWPRAAPVLLASNCWQQSVKSLWLMSRRCQALLSSTGTFMQLVEVRVMDVMASYAAPNTANAAPNTATVVRWRSIVLSL
jgi:hypothetical protein